MSTLYNRTAFERAHERMRRAPLELTDADLAQLSVIDPALETQGHAARREATARDRPDKFAGRADQVCQGCATRDAGRISRAVGARAVTYKALSSALDAMQGEFVKALKTQKDRIATLEAEVERLKARPLQKWAGTFVTGARYSEASLVTHGGSLWVATAATTTTPGTPGNEWRLIVKHR